MFFVVNCSLFMRFLDFSHLIFESSSHLWAFTAFYEIYAENIFPCLYFMYLIFLLYLNFESQLENPFIDL